MNIYLDAAIGTYNRIYNGVLQSYHTYWQLGHAFDTLVDYWTTKIPPAPDNDVAEFVNKYLVRGAFPWDKDSAARNPWWFDDYCWWGIASTRVGYNTDYFGQQAKLFAGIAALSWEPVYRIAPNVWKNADQNCLDDYEPMYDGGVWNWIYVQKKLYDIEFTKSRPNDRSHSNLWPTQNTVTNGLYWVNAAKLYNATKDDHFKEAATTEYDFLCNWFKDSKEPLLFYFDEDSALVRERVPYFKSGIEVRGYDPKLYWAGDQGLVLGGLVEHMKMIGSSHPDNPQLLKLAKNIMKGVQEQMHASDGRLLPWIPYTGSGDHGAPAGDYDDYSTGIAVYMRYLLAAWNENSSLKDYMTTSGTRNLIRATADYFLRNPAEKRCEGHTDCKLLLYQINDLATFLTAYKTLASNAELDELIPGEEQVE